MKRQPLWQREIKQREVLEKKIQTAERQLHRLRVDKKNLEKTMRIRKLIRAGMIFEEAGLLDDYDWQELLTVLKQYKRKGGDVS